MQHNTYNELDIQVPENIILKPHITILGIGGAGCNAVNNMIESNLSGVNFVIANTDSQSLSFSQCTNKIQLGVNATKGLGAGSSPELGKISAEESLEDIKKILENTNMLFITAGMGGGTGTGASSIIAKIAKEMNILTIAVITKPFDFEGKKRMHAAEEGIKELEKYVDTIVIIPNQNLFRIVDEKTSLQNAFKIADDILYSGVRSITDLITMPGLINLDFADIKTIIKESGTAMMGTGEAGGENKAIQAAESAITNPLLDNSFMTGAKGVLINITGGSDMTLYEVDTSTNRIMSEINNESVHIIFGSTFDKDLEGKLRVSVVATGIKKMDNSSKNVNQQPQSLDVHKNTSANLDDLYIEEDIKRYDITNKNNIFVTQNNHIMHTQSESEAKTHIKTENVNLNKNDFRENVLQTDNNQFVEQNSKEEGIYNNDTRQNHYITKDNELKYNQILYENDNAVYNMQNENQSFENLYDNERVSKPSFFKRLFSSKSSKHKREERILTNKHGKNMQDETKHSTNFSPQDVHEFPDFFDKENGNNS